MTVIRLVFWYVDIFDLFIRTSMTILSQQQWGEKTQGKDSDLFGPPYGRFRACHRDSWAVVHNRCDFVGPLCFKKDEQNELKKFHQTQIRGKKCKLDDNDRPIADTEYTPAENAKRKGKL